MTHTFEIKDNFYLDGKPFQIISGGIHYFRVVPEYWKDRLEKLKAMGCNTVETYIPWNMHEPNKGEFHFDGMLDIAKFVKTAQELGLWVIIRPSPYICAEWEFGFRLRHLGGRDHGRHPADSFAGGAAVLRHRHVGAGHRPEGSVRAGGARVRGAGRAAGLRRHDAPSGQLAGPAGLPVLHRREHRL